MGFIVFYRGRCSRNTRWVLLCSMIVAHNHPSGNLEPSQEDRDITYRLQEAGMLLGIELLDHVVFSHKGYYSFLEEGEI